MWFYVLYIHVFIISIYICWSYSTLLLCFSQSCCQEVNYHIQHPSFKDQYKMKAFIGGDRWKCKWRKWIDSISKDCSLHCIMSVKPPCTSVYNSVICNLKWHVFICIRGTQFYREVSGMSDPPNPFCESWSLSPCLLYYPVSSFACQILLGSEGFVNYMPSCFTWN